MPELLHTLQVDLASAMADRSYSIQIGHGLIADASIWQPLVEGRGVVLVTDDQVGPLFGEAVKAALTGVSRLTEVVLPAGEAHKDMTSIQQILDAALADRHERSSLFVALGGGVWGGAQQGAARLDIGPSLTVDLRLGAAPARIEADYRWRVAGNAEPGNGGVVTLSTGF